MVRALALLAPLALLAGCVTVADSPSRPDDELMGGPASGASQGGGDGYAARGDDEYTEDEVTDAVSNWLGVSAETAAALVEKVFSDMGRPNAYIVGGEGAVAVGAGLRYGNGTLYMKTGGQKAQVYWQGPSVGFDVGGNASRTFTLVYNLPRADDIYRRYPGVEGSAYFIGGVGVNYQRADNIVLAPMRVGVGLREGVNVGYLAYSRQRNVLPF